MGFEERNHKFKIINLKLYMAIVKPFKGLRTPSQEVCSLIFTLRLRSHLMTYLLYLRLPQVLIYHPEQVNIFQGICLVVFLPVCQAFYDHPMPYTYLPHLPFHHT